MRNFGAARPVLKSAPLFAHPRAAPFSHVRLADAHDAPVSDKFDHRSVLKVDVSQLVLYHLLGYTLETISDEEDEEQENRRIDAAVDMIRHWGVQKEWGEEEWMGDMLSCLVRGGDIEFPPECRASS